jgi:hypothetical protein
VVNNVGDMTASDESAAPACQAVGVDIVPGFGGFLLARSYAEAARRRGAIWTRTLLLGGYINVFPAPIARPGVMVLSGWTSPELRATFRDSDAFQRVKCRSQSVSLDLGAGRARAGSRDVALNDDGWLGRLPLGKAPRGFVAALTYAHVTPRGAWPFHQLARSAALSTRHADGSLGSVFTTEFRHPSLRVMTFSVWDQRTNSAEWAYHGEPHRNALSWLAESSNLMPGGCFGMFPVLAASGTMNGVDIAQRVLEAMGPVLTPG